MTSTEQPIRIGIIGAGGIVKTRHIPGLRAIPGVQITQVTNRSVASAEGAGSSAFATDPVRHAALLASLAEAFRGDPRIAAVLDRLESAVNSGELSAQRVEDAVTKLVGMKGTNPHC